jgi:hypothetical protein
VLEEAQMAPEQLSPEKARAKLNARMKRDMKRPDLTQAMAQEYASFKSWMNNVRDMVKVSKKKPKPPKPETAAERRAPMLRANARAAAELAGQNKHLVSVDQNYIDLPMVALSKATPNHEKLAFNWHLQGFIVTLGAASRSQLGGRGAQVLNLTDEQRGHLVAMFNYVSQKLPPEERQLSDVLIEQHLMLTERPMTYDEFGQLLTSANDERVRKGGFIGACRMVFAAVRHYQREYHIEQATKRIAARGRQ